MYRFALIITLFLACYTFPSHAQSVIFQESFASEGSSASHPGVSNFALNLTESAVKRQVHTYTIDPLKWKSSFTIAT